MRFISDNIHGSIPYTNFLENSILSNPLFNRLQGIKQNSTAYKTYPTLEHSRFSHSLGVMHLSAQLFHRSFLNSDESTITNFLNVTNVLFPKYIEGSKKFICQSSILERIKKFNSISGKLESDEIIKNKINEFSYKNINLFDNIFSKDKLFSLYNIPLINGDNKYYYYFLFQAIRCSALFHDLGHPPFSHAVEFAIQDFYKKYEKISSKSDIIEIFKSYFNYLPDQLHLKENYNFHENATIIFIQNLFNDLLLEIWEKNGFKYDKEILVYPLYINIIKTLTISIYLGYYLVPDENGCIIKLNPIEKVIKKNIFISLKSLISGEVDADRLDFVLRDGKNSGFSSSAFNLSRIINNFILIEEKKGFHFVPTSRCLSDLEKFFKERLSEYKYIIFHHNVVKTDLVLYKVIYLILKDIIECKTNGKVSLHEKIWQNFWKYIEIPPQNKLDLSSIEHFVVSASAWNEDWLKSTISYSYNFLYKHYTDLGTEPTNKDDVNLYLLLKELIYNRRGLLSLWKRNYTYNIFVTKQTQQLLSNINNLNIYFEKLNKLKKKRIRLELEQHYSVINLFNIFSMLELIKNKDKYGLDSRYLSSIKFDLVKSILEFIHKLNKEVEEELEDKLQSFIMKKFRIKLNVFIKIFANRLKAGVDDEYNIAIVSDELSHKFNLQQLSHNSSIIDELEENTSFYPQLHIYISNNQNLMFTKPGISDKRIEMIIQYFSKLIYNEFMKLLNKFI